jgi:hypothetical protein
MRSSKNNHMLLIVLLGVALALLTYPATTIAKTSPMADRDPVNAAWRRAQESGVYHFSTTVVETTHPVTVTDVCTEVESVGIIGPTSVPSGTAVTLHASYLPADATGVALAWDNGTPGPSAAYVWPETGIYTVVVTATAACGDPVTDIHTINVAPSRRVYLPLVLRDY